MIPDKHPNTTIPIDQLHGAFKKKSNENRLEYINQATTARTKPTAIAKMKKPINVKESPTPTASHMIQRIPEFEKKREKRRHIGYHGSVEYNTYKSSLFQEQSWR